jgi:hypothetical protein
MGRTRQVELLQPPTSPFPIRDHKLRVVLQRDPFADRANYLVLPNLPPKLRPDIR